MVFYEVEMAKGYSINVNGRLLVLDRHLVMGVVNVTPDSFYSVSRKTESDAFLEHVGNMLEQGADIIDVGACSTRPGSNPVSQREELARLHSALELLDETFPDAVVSIDTFRAQVAIECAEKHNVSIINDVSGFSWDGGMLDAVAKLNIPYVLTHSVGAAGNVPEYDNFMRDVIASLSEKVWQLRQRGVKDVIIDPGFGFGKTVEQNYTMLAHLKEFEIFDAPLLVGVSRKSMITRVLGNTSNEALNATSVLNTIALMNGADILRVHDVAAAVEAVKLFTQCAAAKDKI